MSKKATTQDKPKKVKLVRDSFCMPKDEYAAIDMLKTRAMGLSVSVKKSELLRAGLVALARMSDAMLQKTLGSVPAIKTGRPAAATTEATAETAAPQKAAVPQKATAAPSKKSAAKPAAKPAAKTKTQTVAKTAAKPAVKPALKPAAQLVKPAPAVSAAPVVAAAPAQA